MKPHNAMRRLGPRLFVSYLLAIFAGGITGMATALFARPASYHALMLRIMRPPPGSTPREMDTSLAAAVTHIVAYHVALSLGVAIVVSLLVAMYVSREITGAMLPLVRATDRLAHGHTSERVPEAPVYEFAELTANINRLAASLEEAEHRRSLAIGSIGHELRTPVMALRSYVDAVRDGVLEPNTEVWERMAQAVTRLERMAQDLSALGRSERGVEQDVRPEPVAVLMALQQAAESARHAFDTAGLHLEVDIHVPSDVRIAADPVRLGEILDNLLANSLAHTPRGGRVRLEGRMEGDAVRLCVVDEGEGIDPADLPHVTEPFYRGEGGSVGHTPRPGMGLGLTIADRLTRAMGGHLTLYSAGRGLGTTACVRFPRLLSES